MEDSPERLLGKLVSSVESLDKRMTRIEQQMSSNQAKWEAIEDGFRKDLQKLRDFTVELKGGKKVLIALLAVAGVVGGLIWDIVQKYLFSN